MLENNGKFSSMTEENETSPELLKGASLLDDTGSESTVRRPVTVGSAKKELSSAIAQLGQDNLRGTSQLTAAIKDMATALSKPSNQSPAKEAEIAEMRSDITGIKASLGEIMNFLKSKKE